MRIALIHDYLVNMGGSEKVLEQLIELYPEAPIYTAIYKPEVVSAKINSSKIYTSFLQSFPQAQERWQYYLPLMPLAFERFNLTTYDLVISSSHACAKGVLVKPNTCHICYCHTPMRYAWSAYDEYREASKGISRVLFPLMVRYLRKWDKQSSERVHYFICNSNAVRERIAKYYQREAEVIPPPVDTSFFTPGGMKEDFYLMVSRFMPYKKVDLAIEAFNRLKRPLVIIGATVGYGSWERELKRRAKSNINFVGIVSDEQLREYYRQAKAFIFAAEEDFGITAVEAQACGTPVIAYAAGGALDIVEEGTTGIFFYHQNPESLAQAVQKLETCNFDSKLIRDSAQRFNKEIFRAKIKAFVEEKFMEYCAKMG